MPGRCRRCCDRGLGCWLLPSWSGPGRAAAAVIVGQAAAAVTLEQGVPLLL